MSSCGNASLRSCLNISEARLDGRRAVWFGSPLTMEKVTLTENFFWHSPPRIWRKWKHFLRRRFQSFRMKTASIVLCSGVLLICQSNALWGTSGWPQPTLLIQETIYHMSPESAAIDVSSYCKSASSVSIIPGTSICLDVCLYCWNIVITQTEMQKGVLLWSGGWEVDSSTLFFSFGVLKLCFPCPLIWFLRDHQWGGCVSLDHGRKRVGCHVPRWSHDFRCWLDRSSPHVVHEDAFQTHRNRLPSFHIKQSPAAG